MHRRRFVCFFFKSEFCGPVSSVKIMSSRSVKLLKLFWAGLVLLTLKSTWAPTFATKNDNSFCWISGKGTLVVEMISWSISTSVMCPTSGPGVSLTLCCFVVYSTRRFVVCLSVCHFVLVFFSPFSIAITSLGEERANLSAFRTFVRFVLV